MESPRETKRRKLDTPSKRSPASAPASRKKPTPRAAPNGTPASRAKQAREGLSPFSHSKENARPRNVDPEDTAQSTPQGALEKLRAKKQTQTNGDDEAATARPAKEPETPSKASSMAGFFKRFADPRLVSMRANAQDRDSSEDGGSEAAADESDGGSTAPSVRASGRKKQLSTKLREQAGGGTPGSKTGSAVKPKKTFEDEIRDLEAAARVAADDSDVESTTPARAVGGRGSKTQTPKPKSAGLTPGKTPAVVGNTVLEKTPASRKAPNPQLSTSARASPATKGLTSTGRPRGRPRKIVEPIPTFADRDVPEILTNGDAMEVDDSEDERTRTTRGATPPSWLKPRPAITPQKSVPSVPVSTKRSAAQLAKLPSLGETQLRLFQRVALEKIYGKRTIPLTNLNDEYAKVNTVINQTITSGESNSMLLIGARGSGKSTLINQILQQQSKEHPDDFHAVRLNGFIHTDDKIALREIWRQLGREMDLDEEENTARNYADTLASLLALLSHPLELGQEQAPGQTNKSVIFVLDEFDLFASHPRQTLLYNLFDIAQSRKAPIAVLGLTTRIDVAESLEKRVKSRFSHRYVHLSSSKSFAAFVEVCKAALTLQEDSLKEDERDVILPQVSGSTSETHATVFDTWNVAIENVLSSDAVAGLLRRIYYTTKSVPDFLASMLIPFTTLPLSDTTYEGIQDHLTTSLGLRFASPDSKLTILSTLSTLQLALLICAARQTAIHATDTVSFNLAYEEYKLLASKAKIQAAASGAMGAGGRVWSKEVAKDSWMSLIDVGLIMEDSYSGRGGGGAAGRADVSLEEIGESGVDLGTWGRWCKEI